MANIKVNSDGKIQCPKCNNLIVPNVTKYGIGGGATQRICPLCGKRIGSPKGMACCFIATAAYGSPLDSRVQILCDFRDDFLSRTKWGQAFIEFYYLISPRIAYYISLSKFMKFVVRKCLYPIICLLERRRHFKND